MGEGRPSDFTTMKTVKYQKNHPENQKDFDTYRDFSVKNPFH